MIERLTSTINQIVGTQTILTKIAYMHFAINFIGKNDEAVARIIKYLGNTAEKPTVEYDEESDITSISFKFKQMAKDKYVRVRTPEQLAQMQRAYELGQQNTKDGKESMDFPSEFEQMYYYTWKVAQSVLLSEYLKGCHSIENPKNTAESKE